MNPAPQLTVDLTALQANYKLLQEYAAPARAAGVVKANGYGLGVLQVSEALYAVGCREFFTAHFTEALHIRNTVPEAMVAPFHGVAESEFAQALACNITPVLNSLSRVESWAAFAHKQDKKLAAIIHLDTGMNRLGLSPEEQDRLIANSSILQPIEIKYWASHLARAEEFNNPMTTQQRDMLKSRLTQLPKAPVSLCNSSGIFWGKDYTFDLVRPGVAVYGANPTPGKPNPMYPVFEVKAPILQIRSVDTDMSVGYGATHRIARKGRIATLALGYADGYLRTLSSRGQVKIDKFLAPVVGRVSMDLVTVDVSDVPESVAHVGAMAVIIGEHRPLDMVAEEAGTIPYEILTSLGARYERHYVGTAAA